MIRIIARITARPGCEERVRTILQDLLPPTRAEPGCQRYDLFQDEDDPLEFVTIEHWAEQAAADAHLRSAHVAAAIAAVSELLASPPRIHRFAQVG